MQHFPDSPARSAWVVPVGFFVSVLALAVSAQMPWSRLATLYTLALGVVVSVGSVMAAQWFQAHPQWMLGGAGHHHGAPAHDTVIQKLTAQTVTRSVTLHMDDRMRFTPDAVPVHAGETIRFEVHNKGKLGHEFVLGTAEEISAHAALMRQIAAGTLDASKHDHNAAGGAALHVEPGKVGELVVTFPQATTLQMACLLPGHLEAGMRGSVVVSPAQASVQKQAAANHKSSAHTDHAH